MKALRYIVALSVMVFSYSTAFAAGTPGSGVSIAPLKHELTVETGQTVSRTVRIMNTSDNAITLYPSVEDFVAGDDTGTPKFVKPENQVSETYSLSNWIHVDSSDSITLAKGETREVPFTVTAPAKSEPGGHYGAIFFSLGAPNQAQLSAVPRIGCLVLVNVPGNVTVHGDFRSFSVGTGTWSAFSTGSSFTGFPITFETRFENDGNTHIKPTGRIELVDEKGEVLKSVGRETIASPLGAYIGEKLVDYIPVNNEQGNVLPKSNRRFESKWEGIGYTELAQDGTKVVKFKDLSQYYADQAASKVAYLQFWEAVNIRQSNRKVMANLALSYVDKDGQSKDFHDTKTFTVQYTEKYIGLNYTVIGIAIVVVAGILLYIFVVVPRGRDRMRRELLAQMQAMEEMKKKEEEMRKKEEEMKAREMALKNRQE